MFEDKPENRHAWEIPGRAINLPSYHEMTSYDQDRVVAVIRECLGA
jgi:perosamine synthetase